MWCRSIFPLLIVLWCNNALLGQWNGIRMTDVGLSDQLSMQVNAIAQDSLGYLYFGGNQGLKRYDGNSIKHYAALYGDSSSISTGEVLDMKFDKLGDLWLTMRYGGLNRFSPRNQSFKKYTLPNLPPELENNCHGILIDEKEDIWIGSGQIRLYQVDKEADTLITFIPSWLEEDLTERYIINTILQDVHNKDLLWLSITDYDDYGDRLFEKNGGYGVVSFNRKTKKFERHPIQGRLGHQLKNGTLLSTYSLNHILHWNPKTGEGELVRVKSPTRPDRDFITRKIISKGDNLWVSNVENIYEYSPENKPKLIYESDEGAPYINTMFEDRDGNIWVGTAQGALVYNPKFNKIKSFSLNAFQDYRRIYPGRLGYDPIHQCVLFSHNSEMSRGRIYRLFLDQTKEVDFIDRKRSVNGLGVYDHYLYEAHRNGVKVTDLKKGLQYENLMLDDQNLPALWNLNVSEGGVMSMVAAHHFFWKKSPNAPIEILEINDFENSFGREFNEIFEGMEYYSEQEALVFSMAIYVVDLENGKAKKLTIDSTFNPRNDEIFDVKVDSKGFIWAAGKDYLGKFERKNDHLELVDRYTISDGLAMTQVTELFVDYKDRIWCFMANGVSAIDQEVRDVRSYGLKDGLIQFFNDPRQVIDLPDNNIVSVNGNAIIMFHPDTLWQAKSVETTRVTIDHIKVDGLPSDLGLSSSIIEIPYDSKSIDISFQGIYFPSAKGLQYSYRLRGLDDKWVDIGDNRQVILTGLSSGNYTFEVKVGQPETTSTITALNLIVATPFYTSWWFILLMALLLMALIYTLYFFRIQQIKKETQDQIAVDKKIAELELSALRAQMNPHFMFNSLNSIKNFILSSRPLEASEYLSNFAHLIRMILQNSKKSTISIEEELETLELYVELEQMRFDKAFTFECIDNDELPLDQIRIPPMILQPYIENAIWHGLMHKEGNRKLELRFEKIDEKYIRCIIEDNGVGRKAANERKDASMQRYKSMGMGITKERVDIINKMSQMGIEISIVDRVNDKDEPLGTQVRLKIPVVSVF
ncbi:MAG: histidine kinase [Saprospiraceae bacterium]|nr:histidine kinase [Saprospiraceae bacterium]